jgi:hypothetical protein
MGIITAKDILNQIRNEVAIDPKFDRVVIEPIIQPRFKNSYNLTSITIPKEQLTDSGYDKEQIINQLTLRGFCVEFQCEAIACSSYCWFVISIPPQDE